MHDKSGLFINLSSRSSVYVRISILPEVSIMNTISLSNHGQSHNNQHRRMCDHGYRLRRSDYRPSRPNSTHSPSRVFNIGVL